MKKFYLNYETALSLFESNDLVVVKTIVAIQKVMQVRDFSLRPEFPFDMCFFFNSLLKTVTEHIRCELNVAFLPTVDSEAINLPLIGRSDDYFIQSGLADSLLKNISAASVVTGFPFDATFAFETSRRALSRSALASIEDAKGKTFEPDKSVEEFAEGFVVRPTSAN